MRKRASCLARGQRWPQDGGSMIFVTRDFLQKLFQQLVPERAHGRKTETIKIVDFFQGQLRKYGSDAKIKMHDDIPFAAPWWAWLMR